MDETPATQPRDTTPPLRPMTQAASGAPQRLLIAHLVLIATMLGHALDHVRQGLDTLPAQVRGTGSLLLLLALAALPLTVRGHRRAPGVAATAGLLIAAAVVSGHLAPWGAYRYPDVGADGLSWIAMLSEVVAAAAFGAIGLAQMRASRVSPRAVM